MNLNTHKIKSITVISILILTSLYSYAQTPIGAWERYYDDENGNSIRSVVIFSEKFQSIAMYNAKSGEFIYSNRWVNDPSIQSIMENEFKDSDLVVVIFPDHGSRYLSKIYSDKWMENQGFFDSEHEINNNDIQYIRK